MAEQKGTVGEWRPYATSVRKWLPQWPSGAVASSTGGKRRLVERVTISSEQEANMEIVVTDIAGVQRQLRFGSVGLSELVEAVRLLEREQNLTRKS